MTTKLRMPDNFVPDENEFRIYCAILLLKKNYITREEAIKMCGYSQINETTKSLFSKLFDNFEKKYLKMCGMGYSEDNFS